MEADVLIIGGGAAGTVAALLLAKAGKHCIILEKNGQIGRKLRITGKGRCNLTNACDLDTLMANVPRNPKFLYSAFARWMPEDVMAYFEQMGVPLKVERGNRVFPVSDRAEDIVAALQRALKRAGIPVYRETVQQLLLQDGRCTGVQTASGKQYAANCVLLAAGGASYPATGSTGDGYTLAKQAGHTIVPPLPALVPLEVQEKWCSDLMGLSLRNVSLKLYNGKKCCYDALGEMLFTHFGVSGPVGADSKFPAAGADSERWQLSAGTEPETRLDTRTAGQTHSARLYRPPQSGNGHDFPRAAATETCSRFSGSGSHSAGNQGKCSDKRTTSDFGAGLAGISAAYHCKTFAERSDYYTGRRFCSGSTGENYGIQML